MVFVRQVHLVSALLLACASSAGTRYATAAAVMGTVMERAQSISELQASSEWYSNHAQTQVGVGVSVTRLPRSRRLQDATEDDAGAWDDLAQIPLERTLGEVSAGVLTFEGKSYMLVVGEAPIESNNTATLIYDFAEDTWLIGSSREFAGNHHASEVIDNKMYLFGGLTTGNHTIQIASLVQAPQGVDVQWSFGADLPVPSGSAATALIDGQVYYCGGIDAGNTFTYDTCYLYDPVSDTWAGENAVPAMPQGRNHAAACTDGEKMYVFGGRIGENVVGEGFNDTQIYTPGEGWSEGTPLPLARGGMGKAVYYEGECYVLGGEVEPSISPDPSVKISPTRTVYRVDVYSPVTDSWRLAEDMPQGLHGVFPILFEDAIYVAGGGTEAAYSQSTLHMRLSLGTETSSRGIGGDSSAAAPSPGSFRAAAPSAVAPDKSSAAAPASSSINLDSAPETVSRSSAVSITALEPIAWKSTLQAVLRSAPVTAGAKQYVLSVVRAVSLCAQLPWVASVLTSLLAYNMLQPNI